MRSCSRSLAGVCATVRLGLTGEVAEEGAAVSNRLPRLPQADSANAAHNRAGAAKRRRPVPRSRCPAHAITSANRDLSSAEYFDLPHPEHLDPWSSPRRDKAADTNPLIFEGLRRQPGRLERRNHAP